MLHLKKSQATWKLINYREIDDVITAEFLHDLYNQHQTAVNSIRFRNTICIYNNHKFLSYAPNFEWEYLAKHLGLRLFNCEKKLFKEINNYIKKEKSLLTKILKKESLPLKASIENILMGLSDLHYTSLGEVYGINLVQIEHAIEWAIKKHLLQLKNVDLNQISKCTSQLMSHNDLTISALEEIDSLTLSLQVDKAELTEEEATKQYKLKHQYTFNGYGSEGHTQKTNNRIKDLRKYSVNERESMLRSAKNPAVSDSKSVLTKLSKGNKSILALSDLAIRIGILRDSNKALMGRVTKLRNVYLNKISELKNISRKELSRYLLNEIFELGFYNKRLSPLEIEKRFTEPMVFQRSESVVTSSMATEIIEDVATQDNYSYEKNINCICASEGNIKGQARHVLNSNDASKVKKNEIMITYGTDFNFMIGLRNCAGVITEEGGMLSHASVISRELSKPCGINVKNALTKIPNGSTIQLDATKGIIQIIKEDEKQSKEPIQFQCLNHNLEINKYGSKAARLAEAKNKGFNTLPGIVIPVNLIPQNEDYSFISYLMDELHKECQYIPNKVIVRSSSPFEDLDNQSAAGVFESIVCNNISEEILMAIHKIHKSAESPTAKLYFKNKKINKNIAILVQPYLKQDIGGVAFSRDPLKKDPFVLVEANKKGAEYVVEGKVQMRNSYSHKEVNKSSSQSNNINSNTDFILYEIAKTTRQLEKAFKFPVDVEWGVQSDKIYIFQVRPITSMKIN